MYNVNVTYYSNFKVLKRDIKKVLSGWVSPDGTFDDCLYGEHAFLAREYVVEQDLRSELAEAREQYRESAKDFLIRVKKYILLDCPACNDRTQWITFNPLVKRNKKQVEAVLELFKDEPSIYEELVKEFLDN